MLQSFFWGISILRDIIPVLTMLKVCAFKVIDFILGTYLLGVAVNFTAMLLFLIWFIKL